MFCDGHVNAYKGAGTEDATSVYNICTAGEAGGAAPAFGCATPPATPVSGNNPTFNYVP